MKIAINAANRAIADRFAANVGRIGFRTCYCSVLDECWSTDLQHLRTTRMKSCPAPAHPYDFSDRPRARPRP